MRSAFRRDIVQALGAWAYGLELIDDVVIPSVLSVDQPTHLVFDVSASVSEIESRIRSSGRDWAIKYSCNGPYDWSHDVQRGDNSSLGRTLHLTEHTPAFVRNRLERVLYHAPRYAVTVVFQELIDQSDGHLFHADLGQYHIEVEILIGLSGSSHRILAFSHSGAQPHFETSGDRPLSGEELQRAATLLWRLEQCRDALVAEFLCESWSVEGFWKLTDSRLRLLQLRPAPQDRPVCVLHPDGDGTVSADRHDSGFVWGLCDAEVLIRDGEVKGPGVLSMCSSDRHLDWRVGYDPSNLSAMASGRLALVIRSRPPGASRLSHEPWFLPPPEYRHEFCHVWIPTDVLAAHEGHKLRLISDGDQLTITECRRGGGPSLLHS